jgi:hypothetical protein
MNPWNLVEAALDIIWQLCNWRFGICLFAGIALAYIVAGSITAEPLRGIVAGGIVIAGAVVGWRWDSAH